MERSLVREEEQMSTLEDKDYEQKMRNEMMRGCGLAKQLEQQLNLAPFGSLGEAPNHELRLRFLRSSFDIVATFQSVSMLLKSKSFGSQQLEVDAYLSKMRMQPERSIAHRKRSPKTEGLAATTKTGETPPLSPHGAANAGGRHTSSSPLSSSDMSEGSATRPNSLDLDSGDAEEATATGRAGGHEESRKRKRMPKITVKMPCNNPDQGNEIPGDGHTWRKYGQKDILGTRFPRSYYRCTHQKDMGCPAIKQVQKSDDDPKILEVTYQGNHTCRPLQLDNSFWPFASFPLSIPPLAMQCLQALQCPINSTLSPNLFFNSNGGIQFAQPTPLPPPLFQLPPSKPPESPKSTLQPSGISSFPAAAFNEVNSSSGTGDNLLGASNNLINLLRSRHVESNGLASCKSSDASIDPNQKSSVSRRFDCGNFDEIPGHNDSIYWEVEKELAVPLSKELENYDINEHTSADCRFSLDFSQLLPPANHLGAGKPFLGTLREQQLVSEPEATQVRPSLDMELLNHPFDDDFLYTEEDILLKIC